MTKTLRGVMLGAMLGVSSLMTTSHSAMAQTPTTFSQGVGQGVLRIKFTDEGLQQISNARTNSTGTLSIGLSKFDAVSSQFHAHNLRRVFPFDAKNEEKLRKHGLHLWYEIDVDNGKAVAAVQAYASLENVSIAEPILEKTLIDPVGQPKVASPATSTYGINELPTDDPYLSKQWHYENDGSGDNWVENADVNLFDAWAVTTGKKEVIIAIHDEGVDVGHEDLKDNVWVNEIELNGEEGVDDDGNGYVDDIHGYDFSYGQGEIVPQPHGTHVAGTVAATNNNGIGVAGVAGGDGSGNGVRLMALPILSGPKNNTAASYVYAANNGAVISQNSWGYTAAGVYEQSVMDAIDYFIEEAGNYEGSPMKGGIVIFAAGNDNNDDKYYPGYYDRIMTVASTGPANRRAYYSNYGEWVDITAPGGDVSLSNIDGVLSTLPGDQYGYLQGTSMACPHVSGIAGLVLSQFGNAEYTSEALWAQLTNSTSEIYDANPNFQGMMGIGIIDAGLAMQVNEGVAPNAVADLLVVNSSHDFITLSWSVPTDEDDSRASAFDIYYSTEEITAENYMEAASMYVKSNLEAGETVTYELHGLSQTTEYHIAVVARDRWTNASALSNIIITATNNGPEVSLSTSEIISDIDTEMGTSNEETFTIENIGEGLLRWMASVGQSWFNIDTNNALSQANPGTHSSTIPTMGRKMVPNNKVLSSEEDLAPFESSSLSYFDATWAQYVIGETDETLPNSVIQAFYVDQDKDFNITDLGIYINGITVGEPIIEIRVGNIFTQAEVIYNGVIPNASYEGYKQLHPEENILVPAGSIVWLNARFEAGNIFPIGVNRAWSLTPEQIEINESNQWFSFDNNQTFTSLATAMATEGQGWAFVTAIASLNEHVGEYITLSPYSGDIDVASSQEVNVTLDASKLSNGSYGSNIVLETNDQTQEEVRLPVTFNVSNQKPSIKSVEIANFGSVFVNAEKDMVIELANYGYGNFVVASASVNDDTNFSIKESPSVLPTRAKSDIIVTYHPKTPGNTNTVLTLVDVEGMEHHINLFGVAATPSKIDVSPEEQLHTLAYNETTQGSVTINNTGDYPLQYSIPRFSDQVEEGVHRFGYSWDKTNETDATFWEEIEGEEGTIDIGEAFKINGDNKYYELDLGFDFPYYGEYAENLYATTFGMITLDQNDPLNGSTPGLGKYWMANGFISALYYELDIAKNGDIYFAKRDTYAILEYKNCYVKGIDGGNVTFQIVLFDNGNIEFRYLDLNGLLVEDPWSPSGYYSYAESVFLALENPDKQDGITLLDPWYVQGRTIFFDQFENVRVKFNNPGLDLISNLSSTNGLVPVGESIDITFDVITDYAIEGQNVQNISISSNDPQTPLSHFTVKLDITSGAEEVLELTRNEFDFGTVFIGGAQSITLGIENKGAKTANIVSAVLENDHYTLDKTSFEITPRHTTDLKITLEGSTLGDKTDVLTLTNAEGEEFIVNLSGTVAEAPAIALDTTPLSFALNSGESLTTSIEISNVDGPVDLEVSPVVNGWMYRAEEAAPANEIPDFVYSWRDNKKVLSGEGDASAPTFAWIDATREGEKIEMEEGKFTKAYELPFTFNYFGNDYNTIYVADNGYMSFDDLKFGSFSERMGIDDDINNIIAPLWMLGGWDYYDEDPTKGPWYYADEEKVVISYNRYLHFQAIFGGKVSAQVVLYKNGKIKFQYTTENQSGVDSWADRMVIGIENHDASNFVEVAGYTSFVEDRAVVEFVPSQKITIPAGESKTIDFVVDATEMPGGEYMSDLIFRNVTPNKEAISIPVTLNVTGVPEATFNKDSLDYGRRMADGQAIVKDFYLTNKGTDDFDIAELVMNNAGNVDVTFKYEEAGFWGPMIYWVPISDFQLYVDYGVVSTTIQPGQVFEMKATVTPNENSLSFIDSLHMVSAIGDTASIAFGLDAFLPPVLNVVSEDIMVYADDASHESNYTFTVDNKAGNSVLDYNVVIDYKRDADHIMTSPMSTEKNTLENVIENAPNQSVTEEGEEEMYHAILKHDDETSANNFLGFGGNVFHAATKFIAPVDGFELSHVQTWYRPYGLENGKITVTVMVGNEINTSNIIYQEEMRPESNGFDNIGDLFTLPLEETQSIYPNEAFYVVFSYDLGLTHPQGYVNSEESMKNIFFYLTEDGWMDITSAGYNFRTVQWMTRALAKEEAGEYWLTLDALNGSLEEGAEQTITATVKSSVETLPEVSATVNVISNDPFAAPASFEVALFNNQAPTFMEIPTMLTYNEGTKNVLELKASDKEDDMISFEVEGLEAINAEITSSNNGMLNISINPDYDMAGEHTLNIKVMDEHGVEAIHEIKVMINNVNRAPIAAEVETIQMTIGDEAFYQIIDEVFEDEDLDMMEYSIAATNSSVVLVGMADDSFVFAPLKAGTTEVALMATDSHGASTLKIVNVEVIDEEVTSVFDDAINTSSLKNFPNPVVNGTTFSFTSEVSATATINVFNINGVLVDRIVIERTTIGENKIQKDFSHLQNGLYIYTLTVGNKMVGFNKMKID